MPAFAQGDGDIFVTSPVAGPARFLWFAPLLVTMAGGMQEFIVEYLPILVFLAIAVGMAAVIVAASYVAAHHYPDNEKLSSYVCGFDAFSDARRQFDVRFYLVALLFIIFDLEVAFLFPWAVALGEIGVFGFWSMMIFLAILTVGFIYEWRKGALEWE